MKKSKQKKFEKSFINWEDTPKKDKRFRNNFKWLIK